MPVCTVHAGYNSHYFGSERGVTFYNYISDQFSGFHAQAIPGTLRDSLFILDGLLEQQTNLEPAEIMTDTAGYSDAVFGLFSLLGYQFSPRLADVSGARFWRISNDADYGPIQGIARNRINRFVPEPLGRSAARRGFSQAGGRDRIRSAQNVAGEAESDNTWTRHR